MKMLLFVLIGVVLTLIFVVGIMVNPDLNTHENKIRVAYFPNISHAVPIVGIEKGFFSNQIGNNTVIEPLLFDS
ncbi:MAG: sulfate ABC transporter substrate-binding protein, partial [Nitrosopumilus sp. CG10_big_fil_rev_8_21_14_0_10_33_7]